MFVVHVSKFALETLQRSNIVSALLPKRVLYVFLYYLCFYHKVDKYFKCVTTNQTRLILWLIVHFALTGQFYSAVERKFTGVQDVCSDENTCHDMSPQLSSLLHLYVLRTDTMSPCP